MSKNPSQSTSDSFQIFDKTELGNFDLMSSDLAAKKKTNIHKNKSQAIFRWFTRSTYLAVDWIKSFKNRVCSGAVATADPFNFARTSVDSFTSFIAERWHVILNSLESTAWKVVNCYLIIVHKAIL